MVKTNSKKLSSDAFHLKKKNSFKKKCNLFELHVNKEKIRVLGKKQKYDQGLPGISRAKAIVKRKKTLLQEYKLQNKFNNFKDKRIGESNHNFSLEDKNIARFTAIRKQAHDKKNIFNLADDILTHHGQTLSEIEKYDDPRSDDESIEDGEMGKLSSNFVEGHFGGGLLKYPNGEGAKTQKKLIEQLIAESKKRKSEKQKVKEATLELTEKLDSQWKDLIPLVSQKKSNKIESKKNDIDVYDRLMRELKLAERGSVSDRLKTEKEIVKEEKERLEKLEQERILRMKGVIEQNKLHITHRSADDIDDIIYENIDSMLTYNEEGKPNIQFEIGCLSKSGKIVGDEGNLNGGELDLEVSDTEDENDESDDSLADLKTDSIDDKSSVTNSLDNQTELKEETKSDVCFNFDKKKKHAFNETEFFKRKLIMKQAIEHEYELPFTFAFPESYESLEKLFENQSITHHSIIIERMMKYNHQSLAKGNKDKLTLLFAYLLQYLNNKFEDCVDQLALKESFYIFQELIPRMYELAQINPESAHYSLLEVIKEKYADYSRHPKKYPGIEVLVFMKLISILLPTSDFKHQVVIPCFVFMEQLLTKCKLESRRDISYGLFLVTLILEYTSISKRFMPAAINFLSGILHMAIPKTGVKLIKVLAPFKGTSSDLVLLENMSLEDSNYLKLDCSNLLSMDTEESYKVEVLYASIKILKEFHTHYQDLPSCIEIFSSVLKYLESIPMDNYPKLVTDAHDNLVTILKNSVDQRKLPYIFIRVIKPKALKMLEPKIQEIFDRKMHKNRSKGKAEREKLIHKLKIERKGALREIRRDKDFLGRVRVKQRIRSDIVRHEKVKRIYVEAASQQSELKALDRQKKHKK